jgi:hypothetical protein
MQLAIILKENNQGYSQRRGIGTLDSVLILRKHHDLPMANIGSSSYPAAIYAQVHIPLLIALFNGALLFLLSEWTIRYWHSGVFHLLFFVFQWSRGGRMQFRLRFLLF